MPRDMWQASNHIVTYFRAVLVLAKAAEPQKRLGIPCRLGVR